MKNKYKFISIFLILFFLSLSFVSASDFDNETLELENSDIISVDNNANYRSFTELQRTLTSADDGDIIVLNDSYINNVYTHEYTLNIDKAITLDGNGNTLDGNQIGRILNVNTDNVILKNLIFINGKSANSAAISVGANGVTIENCIFENNNASQYVGGAITCVGNNGKIIGSTFKNNNAPSSGGAVHIEGNNFLIENNTFEKNTANNLGGGMIILGNSHKITNNTFTSNFANSSGGGFRIEGNNSIITNNKFNKNVANVNLGGAMICLGNNTYIANNIYTENIAGRDGGAIDLEGYVISERESIHGINNTVIKNTFKNNRATYGGGISIYCKETKIIENEFSDNYASELGGALRWAGTTSTYGMIINNTFNNNSADVSGGAIFATLNKATLSRNTFNKHLSTNKNKQSGGSGGTITIHGYDNLISDNEFVDSTATRSGGTIYTEGRNATISDNKFKNTNAEVTGGAIYAEGDSAKIIHNNFDTTVINVNGGTIRLLGNNSLISENTIRNTKAGGSGGAMYIDGNSITITNNNINESSANGESGGIITINGNNNKIDKNTFTNTKSNRIGGTIYSTGNKTNIKDNTFKNSEASSNGGAIYLTGNAASITENEFETAKAQYGGAIFISSSDSNINNNKFTNNNAKTSGGAINSEGKVTIRNNEFNENSATSNMGGAVNSNGANSVISDNTFKSNTASTGAAISSNGKETQIINNIFEDNKAESNGGALRLEGDKSIIRDNTFKSNTAKGFGAAAYVQGSDVTATNNIFTNNKAGSDKIGGALRWSGDNAKITNNTFRGNTAKTGTAIYGSGANTQITGNKMLNSKMGDNSIRWDGENQNIKDNIYEEFNPETKLALNDVTINYGETAKLTATLTSNNTPLAGKNVSIKFNNVEITKTTDSKGQVSVDVKKLNAGTYPASAKFEGDEYYPSTASATVKIKQVPTTIKLTGAEDTLPGKNVVLTAEVNTNEGIVIFNVNNKETQVNITNKKAVLNIKNIAEGTYKVTATYKDPSNNYLTSKTNATFKAEKITTKIEMKDVTISYGKSAKLTATLTSNNTPLSEKTVTITFNDKKTTATTDNKGQVNINIKDLNANTYKATANFEGDNEYKASKATATVTINKASTKTTLTGVKNLFTGENATIIINVNASGELTIKLNDEVKNANYTGGDFNLNLYGLKEGKYKLTVKYTDKNNNYLTSSADASFTVSKRVNKLNVKTNDIEEGQDAVFYISTTAQTGKVTLSIGGKTYTEKLSNGKSTFTVSNLTANTYKYTVSTPGDDYYESNSTTGSINVKSTTLIINAPILEKYFSSPEMFTVTITDKEGNPLKNITVSITLNNMAYKRTTDDKGVARMKIGLPADNYPVLISFAGNDDYSPVNVTSNIIIKPTVYGSDITKVEKAPGPYSATFLDSNGNKLTTGKAQFNINGVFYYRNIVNGVAKLNLNLEAKKYVITAINQVTQEMTSNNITITPRFANNSDIVKYYRNDTQYYITLIGDDGKPVSAGETVTFNINGVMYQRQTNANGTAKLNINLNPGDYIITAMYKNCMISNKVKVLPIIIAKDLVMKYKDGHKFEAKLVDGQGNPVAGKNITFNINGVFYNRATGTDGIAKLNINLMAGEYIITSYYGTFATSNKITIKS